MPIISFHRQAVTMSTGAMTAHAGKDRQEQPIEMGRDRPPIDRRSNDRDCQQRKDELCRNHDPWRNGADPCGSAMKDALHEGRLVKIASENEAQRLASTGSAHWLKDHSGTAIGSISRRTRAGLPATMV